MNRNKILSLAMAAFGLMVAGGLLYGALKFYHTIHELTNANPSIVPPHENLKLNTDIDTLLNEIASYNQQIAEKLKEKTGDEKNRRQMLLHETITNFIFIIDSLQQSETGNREALMMLKNTVNKTNMGCRAALFETKDAEQIPELKTFLILDENKLENTIFECFSKKQKQCFDIIKHQALYLEWVILEKNFTHLKT